MKKMKSIIFAVSLFFGFLSSLNAKPPCAEDSKKFCNAKPTDPVFSVMACLKKNKSKLSKKCSDALNEMFK